MQQIMTNLAQRRPKKIFKRMEARTRCPPRRVKTSKRARQTHKSEYSKMPKIHAKIITKSVPKSSNIVSKSTPGPPQEPYLNRGRFWDPLFPLSGSKRVSNGTPKSTKNRSFFDRFWGPIGDPFGARKGEIRGLKSDLCSSRVPGGIQGSILEGFLMILGPILWWFWHVFWTSWNPFEYLFGRALC